MKFANSLAKYFSMVKFSHTIFSMPFAMIGFVLGVKHQPDGYSWMLLLLVILCVVFARNAAMGFNRYIDREIDLKNPRTILREIPAQLIKPKSALFFVLINGLLFMATAFFINPLCFYLSPIALLVVLGYSFTKRFTGLCHLILGLGLAIAPLGAFLAVTASFSWIPIFFSLAVLFWVSGFDTIYALQDMEFDKEQQLFSIPVRYGLKKALIISLFLHLFSALFIIIAGFSYDFKLLYWIGAVFFILLLAYQHIIVKPDDLSRINLAFFTTNGVASVIFATFVIIDILVN